MELSTFAPPDWFVLPLPSLMWMLDLGSIPTTGLDWSASTSDGGACAELDCRTRVFTSLDITVKLIGGKSVDCINGEIMRLWCMRTLEIRGVKADPTWFGDGEVSIVAPGQNQQRLCSNRRSVVGEQIWMRVVEI
ncbi:unnamed protein product [Ilex paraguariensis]|uniref:Uncharacterized protein n=1 Tax=Ilex paraguariensis TaxID=185542 RepID=A0ABC8RUG8_9AQUA